MIYQNGVDVEMHSLPVGHRYRVTNYADESQVVTGHLMKSMMLG